MENEVRLELEWHDPRCLPTGACRVSTGSPRPWGGSRARVAGDGVFARAGPSGPRCPSRAPCRSWRASRTGRRGPARRGRTRRVAAEVARNRWAARQGPIVCELDGPTPILKMSKTLIASTPTSIRLSVPRQSIPQGFSSFSTLIRVRLFLKRLPQLPAARRGTRNPPEHHSDDKNILAFGKPEMVNPFRSIGSGS